MSFKPVYTINFKHLVKLFKKKRRSSIVHFMLSFSKSHNDVELLKTLFKENILYTKCINMLCSNPHAFYWIEECLNNNIVNINDLDWIDLSSNPNAIPLLEKHLDKVNWERLSQNPNAIPLLEKHLDKVEWNNFSGNPNAIPFLEKRLNSCIYKWFPFLNTHVEKVFWCSLSSNPNALSLLEQHFDKINWCYLSSNPNAIHLIEKNLDKINWGYLSLNPNAIHILEKNMDKINWDQLSKNPNAVHILEKNLDKIHWENFALNSSPNAVELIKNNLDKIDKLDLGFSCFGYHNLGMNPNISQIIGSIDYNKMRLNCQPFAKELAEYVFHPSRLLHLCVIHGIDLADYMELIGD